jgi:hypothetical protein
MVNATTQQPYNPPARAHIAGIKGNTFFKSMRIKNHLQILMKKQNLKYQISNQEKNKYPWRSKSKSEGEIETENISPK